jgi:hypothetical protein
MKTFGRTALILQATVCCICFTICILLKYYGYSYIMVAFPTLLAATALLNMPVIHVGPQKIRLYTLTPFYRSINVNIADVHKISIEYNHNIRFTVQMNDGTVQHATCARHFKNLQPLYEALYNTGVVVETKRKNPFSF